MGVTFPINIQTYKMSYGQNKAVFIPQMINMQNPALQSLINQEIINVTQLLVSEQVDHMLSTVQEMIGTYEMKNNQRKVLSLSLSNYTYHYRAAHGLTIIKSLTFDLEKGVRCKLKDLFKPGSNYVGKLSSLIQEKIKQRDVPLLSEFTGIQPEQDFYIADKTLVIYFQLYEITPYVYGFPMFPISVYELQDIIYEEGPLGRMAVNN